MKKRKVAVWVIIITAVLSLITYSVLTRIVFKDEESYLKVTGVPVIAAKPERGRIEKILGLSGNLEAISTITVISKIPGKIEKIYVREGDAVEQDQLLVRIEDDTVKLQREQAYEAWQAAEAQAKKARKGVRAEELENAKALLKQAEEDFTTAEENFERSKNLYKAGTISKAKYEEAESRIRAAQTELENAGRNLKMMEQGAGPEEQEMACANARAMEAQYRLAKLSENYSQIKASASGIIAKILVDEGNLVGQSNPILAIIQDNPIIASVAVPEKYYGRILKNRSKIEAEIAPAAYSDSFNGKISGIGAFIDPLSRTFTIEIEINNPEGLLRPGMYVQVELVLMRVEQALIIPSSALVQREGRKGVFVLDKGNSPRVLFKELETGIVQGAKIQVISGIDEFETVVIDGNAFLEDGQEVRIVE